MSDAASHRTHFLNTVCVSLLDQLYHNRVAWDTADMSTRVRCDVCSLTARFLYMGVWCCVLWETTTQQPRMQQNRHNSFYTNIFGAVMDESVCDFRCHFWTARSDNKHMYNSCGGIALIVVLVMGINYSQLFSWYGEIALVVVLMMWWNCSSGCSRDVVKLI